MADVSNRDDVIDSRDVIKRIAELESEIESTYNDEKGDNEEFPPIIGLDDPRLAMCLAREVGDSFGFTGH